MEKQSTSSSCSQGEGLCQHRSHQLYSEHLCQQYKCWHVSISVLYLPQNVHSLIRPNTENGLLIADPENNSFLRETFLRDPGGPSDTCQ